ncbi:O-antigen ligase family protein [Myxacorys almedinensis]|uniref:Polymerase n=1 Tax=Myxacorys almedinensis A TaxID=2690445 RepID=A0A8J8CKR2_9CYAN|nr:O-antigen ligase family protein [Myxacorys almedinensis]NDJ19804.1 polymerase [Myxacorys almedinensis A]
MNWFRLQRHPHPSFDRHWKVVQIGLFLLPFSSFLGGVSLLVPSLVIWRQQFAVLSRQPICRGFALLSGWLVISAWFASDRTAALLGLFNFLPFFVVFAALSYLIQTPDQLRRMAWILVLTSIPVSLIGFAQLFLPWGANPSFLGGLIEWTIDPQGTPPGRMASVFTYANILASYYGIIFVLGLGLWIEETSQKPASRRSYFLASVILGDAIALILTHSRNAWAIALLTCLAFALYWGWAWIVAGISAIAGVILGAAFAPDPVAAWFRVIVPKFIWARLNNQMYSDRPLAQLRSTQWRFAWSLAEQRPLTGWGLRSFTPLYESQMNYWLGHPHNLFLMMAAETGFPGALLLYGLVGWVMAQGTVLLYAGFAHRRRDRHLYFTFLLAFSACTLFSFLDITLFDARINLMGWVLLAGIWGQTLSHPPSSVAS